MVLITSSHTLEPEKPLRKSDPFTFVLHARDADDVSIVSYMTKQALPAVSLLTADTLEEFKTTDKVVVVAYIAADDKTSNQTYTTLAESLRDEYIFGATNDAALATAEGVKQPSIVLYKEFDEGKNIFSDAFQQEAISSFISTSSTPLVGEVGPETYAGYINVSFLSPLFRSMTSDHRPVWYSSRLHLLRNSRRTCFPCHRTSITGREIQGSRQLCHHRRKGLWRAC